MGQLAAALVVSLLLALPLVALAAPTIIEYPIPHNESYGIAAGPDGNLWFAEIVANNIGKITTAGVVTEYPIPTAGSQPFWITAGPDGNLWFTEEAGSKIGKITTAGTITEYPIPTASSDPSGITTGPDGNLWFTEGNPNKIGKITTAGTITEYTLPTAGSNPSGITPGPDGNLWFTEVYGNKIGKITTTGTITEYPIPTARSGLFGITPGPDGNLWFTEEAGNKIGKITTTGTITEYPISGGNVNPIGITAGPDGNLWFVLESNNKVGMITTAGTITQYPIPTNSTHPFGITAGPDGNIWFTEQTQSNIGKVVLTQPPTLSKTFSPATIQVGGTSTLTFNVTNPNPGAGLTNVSFSDSLPAGVTIAAPSNLVSNCGGVTTANFGPPASVSLSGGSVAAGQSCTISINVTAATTGVYTNTVSSISATESGAASINATATLTVVLQPTVSINNVSKNEGNAGQTAFTFTVSLSSPSSQPVSLDFATADGTATTADNDYQGQFGPLTIPAGQTTATITINVNGDTKLEPDETFTVTLSNPVNATLGAATGTGTILNDDTAPTISIGNVSQAEGNAGTTAFNFPVTLSNATAQAVTVNYATADGTATTADNDYAAATGTLTIPAGQSTGTITVNVNGDTKTESNETFTVALSNPSGATLGTPSTATGTIVNDDGVPSLSIAGVTQAEGNAGQTAFNFTVSLSNPNSQPVTVKYATADGTATIADNDYQAATGTLTIPAGQTTGTITVLVNGDTKFEPDETFSVALSSPNGATLGATSTATGTITNDDGAPTISIGDVSLAEGNSGTTAFNFAVTLSVASGQPVVVQYATADGTATLADNDYAAATGTLAIPAGQTTGTITVNVNGDTKVEPNETFTVNLTNPTGATLNKATGTGTIVNDDSPPPPTTPAVSVADVRQREGNSGTTAFNFTVRLSAAAAGPVTVNYATLDDTATIADKDYLPTSGSLTFAPGETAKTVTVLVNGDTKIEPDEVFFLVLTNPTGANLGKGTAQGVILNDDGEVDEADLVGKLRVTPDREFDLDGNGLLTYVLTVKNIGLGASSAPAVQLPIDSDFEVAYATFTTDSVPGAFYEKTVTDPTTAVLPYAVLPYAQLRLPVLAPGQAVTATVVLRAIAGAKPGELNTRFAIVWDNLDGKPHHYYSNRVHLHLGKGTTRNETDGLVQFLGLVAAGNGLDEQGRATVQLGGDIYAPGERVYLWYTDGNGKSTGLGYVWADQYSGELNAQLTIPGWQSGQRYFLAALGDRSGVIGSATVLVQSRATTQNLTENERATTSGYNYAEVASLFDSTALQTVLKGLTAEQ